MATVRRTGGNLHPARHCCHASPDISPRGGALYPRRLVCTARRWQGLPVSESIEDGGRAESRPAIPPVTYLRHDRRGGVRSPRGPSLPHLRRAGMATVRRIDGDIHPAWHCYNACPNLSPRGRRTVPTTACLYGPEMAGPTRQWGIEDGKSATRRTSWESARESASPSHRPHTPLTRQDGEWQQ